MRVIFLLLSFFISGCVGDRITPEWINHPNIKTQYNEICIYVKEINNDYFYDFIRVQKSHDEKIFTAISTGNINAQGCLPNNIYRFEAGNSYSIYFSIKNKKNATTKVYQSSFDVYQVNGKIKFKGV